MSFPSHPALSEEFRVLSVMHNIGATTPERSMTVDELTQRIDMNASAIRACIQKLRELGYVEPVKMRDIEKYHLTQIGIIKVLTLYS